MKKKAKEVNLANKEEKEWTSKDAIGRNLGGAKKGYSIADFDISPFNEMLGKEDLKSPLKEDDLINLRKVYEDDIKAMNKLKEER